jgi:hypothetical protein
MRETPAAFARRVSAAADTALAEQQFVAPIDIMTGLGWIHDRHIGMRTLRTTGC